MPSAQPTISLLLLLQVGAMPGAPGAAAICSAAAASPRGIGRADEAAALSPDAHATREGVAVVTEPNIVRQPLEAHGIAAAEHDVVCLENSSERLDHMTNRLAPFLVSAPSAPALANVILEGMAVLVRHVTDFRRLDHAVDDERRPEPGAEPEKQHAATVIAANGLHGGIIEDAQGLAERVHEIVAHPSPAEVVRLPGDASVEDHARIAHRYGVEFLATDELAQLAHHAGRRHPWPGYEFIDRSVRTNAELHVLAADIDYQDLLRVRRDFPFGSHQWILP